MFDKHCAGVGVGDNRDKWDLVEAVGFMPAAYDCRLQDGDDGVVLFVDVDLVAGEYCSVSCICEFCCASEGRFSNARGDVDVACQCPHIGCSLPILLAASMAPLGRRKFLSEGRTVKMNGLVGVLILEIAPLSTMAERIDQSSTPLQSFLSSWRYVCLVMAASWSAAHR